MKIIVASCMIFLMLGLAPGGEAHAGAPGCHTHSSGPYCSYSGTVARAYINDSNTILLYFDTNLDLSAPSSVGISGITSAVAAAYRLTDNPEFGKMLYSTLLTAQSRGATISVQMRDRVGGYLRIDRIWIYE